MSFATTVWDYRQLSGKHLLLGKEAVWSAGCGSCGFCHPLGSEGSLPYFLHIWMTVSIYQRTPQNELFPLEEWFGGFTYMCLPCYYKSTLLLPASLPHTLYFPGAIVCALILCSISEVIGGKWPALQWLLYCPFPVKSALLDPVFKSSGAVYVHILTLFFTLLLYCGC